MARYAGEIGYAVTAQTEPGIYSPVLKPRKMVGDVISASKRYEGSDKVNSNITLSHRISVLGDAFAFENFMFIKYATYLGTKWEVISVEIQRPRLILSLGGVYHE